MMYMKMVFVLGLFLMTTILSFGQTAKTAPATKSDQKKEQRVKVMVSQNGKVTNIDTTFNFPDEKLVKLKVDSLLKKLEIVDGKDGNADIVIIKGDGNMHWGQKSGGSRAGGKEMKVFYMQGDSGSMKNQKKVVHIMRDGEVTMFGHDGDMMPPPPPPPPFRVQGFKVSGGDPFAMDPDNKDIISYDRKDIGKGLEKITIVRKKQTPPTDAKQVEVKVEVSDEKN
jgi:biopolymer transport protein ExbD